MDEKKDNKLGFPTIGVIILSAVAVLGSGTLYGIYEVGKRIKRLDMEIEFYSLAQKENPHKNIAGNKGKTNTRTYKLYAPKPAPKPQPRPVDKSFSDKSWRDMFRQGVPTNALGFPLQPKTLGTRNKISK